MTAQNRLLGTDDLAPDDDPADDEPSLQDGAPEADEPRPDASVAPTGVDAMDQRQAAAAYRKLMNGEVLTQREHTALKRYEKDKEERLRWEFYASIPQKHWRRMSGR